MNDFIRTAISLLSYLLCSWHFWLFWHHLQLSWLTYLLTYLLGRL